jgi:hypothetical protein
MLESFDRVKETSASSGTGNFTLAGAVAKFLSFSSRFAIGEGFFYAIVAGASNDWEVGEGHLSGATTLVRDRVLQSSNSNALVSFPADATTEVFNTIPGETASSVATIGRLEAASLTLAGII